MGLPNQLIPESQKDKEWIKECMQAVRKDIDSFKWTRQRDDYCRSIWYADIDDRQFDYLRKFGEYELPAKVRFVPLLRPKGERLKGEYTERPFIYSLFTVDKLAVKSKLDSQQDFWLEKIRTSVLDKLGNLKRMQNEIMQLQQQAQQSAQPGNIQPGMGGQGGQMIPPEVAQQLEVFQQSLKQQGYLTQKEVEEIEKNQEYSSKDLHELHARKGLEYMRWTQNLDKQFYEAFENKLITDKVVFWVDWDTPYEDPTLERVNTDYFYYSYDDEIDFVQDAEWQCRDAYMSIGTVLNKYRYELSFEDREKLENKRSYYGAYTEDYRHSYGGTNYINKGGVYQAYSTEPYNLVRVSSVYFRSPRAVHWKKTPNQYLPGEYHQHIVDDTDIPPPEKRKKDEMYDTFYIDDIYEGILIEDDIFVRLRRKPVQLRSLDKYGKVQLPGVGIAYHSKNRRPYSLIWAAKEIQILWNIVHFHKELWVALSGVKGAVMDKSQKPKGMSDAEWRYQRKMGTMWIQSDKGGRSFSFNQFRTYDDSIGQSLQYLIELINHLDDLASKIMGVSSARQGEVAPSDQVGTTERSIRQSTLTTEPIYWEFDLCKQMALERLVNLSRLAWKDGKTGAYSDGVSQQILNIPPGLLYAAEYRMFLKHGGKEMRTIDTLRQAAITHYNKGGFSFPQLTKLFSIDNLNELEKTVEYYQKKAEEKQEELQNLQHQQSMELNQAQAQAEMEKDQNRIQMEKEYEMKIQEMGNQVSQVANQLKAEMQEWEKQKTLLEMELKKVEIQVDAQSKGMDVKAKLAGIESERMTEFAYLDEDRRQFDIEMGVRRYEDRQEVRENLKDRKSTEKIEKEKAKNVGNQPKEKIK